MTARTLAEGPICPAPLVEIDRVQLGHGSGGKMSAALLRDLFLLHFGNETLSKLADAAVVAVDGGEIAVSTDSFVVHPIEFPGGTIGSLAIHGTLNDLAMMGAMPRYVSSAFILEEGLSFELLERVIADMARAAREASVTIITGDTKVVERGKADGLYVNTTGIGMLDPVLRPRPDAVQPGDLLLVSGPLAQHGMAIMAAREGLAFETEITSDSACLVPLVDLLRGDLAPAVRAMRDPTRGGLASALNEIAAASGVGVLLDEAKLTIPGPVAAACEVLGLDPLYVANEGMLAAFVAPDRAEEVLARFRSHPLGAQASIAGVAVADHPGLVVLRTRLGSRRVVDMLPGDQLPRIC